MKVLILGDSPTVSTGFARCTLAAAEALTAQGHEVVILGINYFGDPHDRPWRIYPCRNPIDGGIDSFGLGRLPRIIERENPDIVVIIQDPWNIRDYLDVLDAARTDKSLTRPIPPVVGWLAVDSKNHKLDRLNDLAAIVVWTEFAKQQLEIAGVTKPIHIVPLGVDLDLFRPIPRDLARSEVMKGVPHDCFLIGVVGRNQPRKRLDLTLDYFKHFVRQYNITDARLFLHVAPTGDTGFDIVQLVKYHGLHGLVFASIPQHGTGENDATMPYIYSALDVYWTTSQAEGWGLPALEAMACGIPCVLPDFAAFDKTLGWTGNAAMLIPCEEGLVTAPLNGYPYTVGGIPKRLDTSWGLNGLHKSENLRQTLRERGLGVAHGLPWHRTGTEICAILEGVALSPAGIPATAAVST